MVVLQVFCKFLQELAGASIGLHDVTGLLLRVLYQG